MFFCWIESHPTFVGATASLLVGLAAIGGGALAYFGARAQANATEEHTKSQERQHAERRREQETSYVIAISVEITDIITRIVSIRRSIVQDAKVSRRHARLLQNPIIFNHKPDGVAFFPNECAHMVVRFYNIVDTQKIAIQEDTARLAPGQAIELSKEFAKEHGHALAVIVKTGLLITDKIAEIQDFMPDYEDWKKFILTECPIDDIKTDIDEK
ncbi:hypothetical protein [Thalassospira marina]|uniref:Uncharacterized protein n=1 Tax=Thalassospira marina TaxID=2048283 RepID=A0ABN5FFN5_9PROT|nr:hypothetical protein [Thalassospira marina]AUG53921.1 hypothetical protein CSC3H3_15250 [Thalassospira marina]